MSLYELSSDMISVIQHYYYVENELYTLERYHKMNAEISVRSLSNNPDEVYLLDRYIDTVSWISLSMNPNAIHLLE